MKDKFRTKAGRLTPYALACGYIETQDDSGISTTLWHEGGILYHVRQHDHNNGKRVFWESFGRLTDARKCYDNATRGTK